MDNKREELKAQSEKHGEQNMYVTPNFYYGPIYWKTFDLNYV